ncbi:zinc finger protein 239 isoform X1 [Boleophthalmus pectinirostris]|uniref:zinc finger protein 239 isoform X1 n=1 Tax=Boleophthalmus pectinirostris TaxID=150288 RepID=UPI00242BA443|nr:zinc finger protein 239 isoform X1 [Boleophthalmus pectinirostris]
MAETIVAFQSQLSGVMEAVFKAAMFEITRLVEDTFLEEVTRCKEQVKTLQRKLQLSESRMKQREADANQRCANCRGTRAGQQASSEQTTEVQTESLVKQESEMSEDVNSPQTQEEVKDEVKNSPKASLSTCAQSKKLNRGKRSSDLQDMSKFALKRDSSDDEPNIPGSSGQLSDSKYTLNWEDTFEQKQSEQNGDTDHSSDPLFQNRYDMDNMNNLSYEDTNVTGIDNADDDDLVYMGQYEDTADEPQTCQTVERKENSGTWSSPSEDIDCLLINEDGHLQDPNNINSDCVDSDQNVRDELNCVGTMPSDRSNDMLGETNTITDISHMIEMLQQQTMENGLHTCNLCLATFPDSATLKAHKQTHKEPEKGLPYLCNQRRKTFTRNCNLKSQGPHLCGHCGKAFTSLFKLQKHKCEHMGVKPYSCAVCGNKFSRLWNLKLHQRIHTQEKPHHCSMCDKSFTRADILKVHERTHTGERPYCCLVCGLSFKRLDHLKSHQRKHAPDQ